jgi:hypothetical protein
LKDHSAGTDAFEEVYNGKGYPHVFKFTVADKVIGGQTYSFHVQAMNYNGLGEASTEVEYTVCTVPGLL